MNFLRQSLRQLPRPVRSRLKHLALWPPVPLGRFAMIGRREPVSRTFGFDRGLPIDRYYIESFLSRASADIHGNVLEVAEDTYTRKFGNPALISKVDVLHAVAGNPTATLVGDLATGAGIPENTFDCMILTQTLHVIYDMKSVVLNLHRALRMGGVVLVTCPTISQISRYDEDRWGDYWRLTPRSAKMLFSDVFGAAQVSVTTFGNVTAAVGILHGLSVADVGTRSLNRLDSDYPVTIGIRAEKG